MRLQAATLVTAVLLVVVGCGRPTPRADKGTARGPDKNPVAQHDSRQHSDNRFKSAEADPHEHSHQHSHADGHAHSHAHQADENDARGPRNDDPLSDPLKARLREQLASEGHEPAEKGAAPADDDGRQRLEDRSIESLLDELLAAADEGRRPGELTQHLGERGMAVLTAALPRLIPQNRRQLTALCEVLAIAGRERRYHAELLRLYDPAAWNIFYTKEGIEAQLQLARALDTSDWPRELSVALVTAAPAATLEWLQRQATAEHPRVAEVRLVARQWGQWIAMGNERQYRDDVGKLIVVLAAHPDIKSDAAALVDLVRSAGDCRVDGGLALFITALGSADREVRCEATNSLGKLTTDAALSVLRDGADGEGDPEVLIRIAAALGNWPQSEQAAESLQKLFRHAPSPAIRREIIYSIAASRSSLKTDVLRLAFDEPGDGVLGVALEALAGAAPKELREPLLALADEVAEPQPALIDALGALGDERGSPYLVRCLRAERSTPVRLKAALALEKVGGPVASEALLAALKEESEPLLVEHLAGIVGNLKMTQAAPALIVLAEDTTAPMAVRAEAIWSLGALESPEVDQSLTRLATDPRKYFGHARQEELAAGDAERIELAELFLAMARLRHGAADAAAQIDEQFERGTATTQLSTLLMLARLKLDHPVIVRGLAKRELAILLGAVRAAGAADPRKYHARLVELHGSVWVQSLLASSADTLNLRRDLEAAIAAGEEDLP